MALRRLAVPGTDPSSELDEMVRVLASTFGTASAAVTLLDSDRQWFKASVGVDLAQTPRETAFCDHTVRQEGVMVVEDATLDARFTDNPLVVGRPGIRFYAGAPVTTHDGLAVGSLCVFDPRARTASTYEQEVLLLLAGRVGDVLEREAGWTGRPRPAVAPHDPPTPLATGAPGSPGEGPDEGRRTEHLRAVVRAALAGGTVGVEYQPVYDLATGRVVAVEALLRLPDASGAVLPAAEVVAAAEGSGAIVELGRRVLRLAATQAAHWQREHGAVVPVAVNVSAAQLSSDGFQDDVMRAVERAGIPPHALSLELTESVLLDVGSPGVDQLRELAGAGVALAIDDFGTGYASLTYLRDLPASTLKIDRSFVEGIPSDHRDTAIVAGVIGLAKSFGLACIAEGIETPAQLEFLASRGVLGQGYLLGRPGDAEATGRLIAHPGLMGGWPGLSQTYAGDRDAAGDRRDDAGSLRDDAGDRRDHDGDERDEAGDVRDRVADRRDRAGDRRDAAADVRDELADARDRAGARRDRAAERRDRRAESVPPGQASGVRPRPVSDADARRDAASDRLRASEDRAAGASERVLTRIDRTSATRDRATGAEERSLAETDRTIATADRGSGAGERVLAGVDRDDSHADRRMAAQERRSASTDLLTGLCGRDAGLHELERLVSKSRREERGLVLAFVDADGLKRVNDSAGHAAGDQLLVRLAEALTTNLREYDLVVRYGGDEFLCVLPDMDLDLAASRLDQAALGLAAGPGTFTFGLAVLEPHDTVESLVGRADAALYDKRRGRSTR